MGENLCAAEVVELLGRGLCAAKDERHSALAGDVLNLTAAEVILRSQRKGYPLIQIGNHRLPYSRARLDGWALELNLIDEAALKRLVKILRKVGCSNHNTLQLLHLLQNDVLDGILHLIHRSGEKEKLQRL